MSGISIKRGEIPINPPPEYRVAAEQLFEDLDGFNGNISGERQPPHPVRDTPVYPAVKNFEEFYHNKRLPSSQQLVWDQLLYACDAVEAYRLVAELQAWVGAVLDELELRASQNPAESLASDQDQGSKQLDEPPTTDVVAPSPQAVADQVLIDLEEATPQLDKNNGQWVKNKVAANLDGIETGSLKTYRYQGQKNSDKNFGCDVNGRVWRRAGTERSHPWYLKKSLTSQNNTRSKP